MTGTADDREVVVVTGASGGIGAAICSVLGAEGYEVIAQYRSREDRATELKSQLKAKSVVCHFVQADLASNDGVAEVARCVGEVIGDDRRRLRGLINNAGVMLSPSFEETSPDVFDLHVAVNVKAPFFLAQRLSTMMQAGSSIVNISSASAHIASAGDIAYAMSKSAVESLTRNMAVALAPRGIRVNAVVPGFTDNGHAAFQNASALGYMGSLSPLGGVGSPQHVADAVAYLLSDKAARTTGALFDVTGGMTLHPRPARGSVRELL